MQIWIFFRVTVALKLFILEFLVTSFSGSLYKYQLAVVWLVSTVLLTFKNFAACIKNPKASRPKVQNISPKNIRLRKKDERQNDDYRGQFQIICSLLTQSAL